MSVYKEGGKMNLDKNNVVHDSFKKGKNFKIGNFCVIEEDVVVGDNVTLGHHVMLKKGTRFENNVEFADYCVTTGACWVGNNTAFRTGAILSKSVIVEDNVFYGPGVVTNHTKHVSHMRSKVLNEQLLTIIGFGSIIGTQASIVAGVRIAPLCIVGGGGVLVKDLEESGVYVGNPVKKIMETPEDYKIELPYNAGEMYLTTSVLSHLQSYIKNLKF
jgi:UDP-2-acetamido-3-amino-2,3-dideoxy-glucuronate N-acetyltransferase